MWFPFVRWLARRSLRWFFRDIVVVGAERVPAKGPVVVIANHPNDLPDVLTGYLVSQRPIHYVATVSAATNAIARWVYRSLGVIPVTRIRDARRLLAEGADPAEVNRRAYRRFVEAIEGGAAVAIFPEGAVQHGPKLGDFRHGVAEMLLQCVDGKPLELPIVPVGLQYDAFDVPGTDCAIRAGEPVVLTGNHGENRRTLTALLRNSLRPLVRHAETRETRLLIDELAAAFGGATGASRVDALVRASEAGPLLSAKMAGFEGMPAVVIEAAATTGALVERCGGRRSSAPDLLALRTATDSSAPTFDPSVVGWLMATPFALIGWLVHAPLFAFIWRHALRTAEAPAHRVAQAFIPGIYIVAGWYLLIALFAAALLELSGWGPPWLAIPVLMLLPSSGDLAVEWRHAVRRALFSLRARRLSEQDRLRVQDALSVLRDAATELMRGHEASAALSRRVIA